MLFDWDLSRRPLLGQIVDLDFLLCKVQYRIQFGKCGFVPMPFNTYMISQNSWYFVFLWQEGIVVRTRYGPKITEHQSLSSWVSMTILAALLKRGGSCRQHWLQLSWKCPMFPIEWHGHDPWQDGASLARLQCQWIWFVFQVVGLLGSQMPRRMPRFGGLAQAQLWWVGQWNCHSCGRAGQWASAHSWQKVMLTTKAM